MHQDSSEDIYSHVSEYHEYHAYSEREKLAIEYAEKFALDHLSLDENFFERLKNSIQIRKLLNYRPPLQRFLPLAG